MIPFETSMLNPFATDFKPFTPAESKSPPRKHQDQTKKKFDANTNNIKKKPPQQQSTKAKKSNAKSSESQVKPASTVNTNTNTNTDSSKKKDSQASSNKKAPLRDPKSRNRRKSSRHDVSSTSSQSIVIQFSQEAQFIAIEAAIDPVHRIEPHNTLSTTSGNRRTSLATEQKFEHGYERYIDWIDRSLRLYDTVTVVGMDNAIVDVVSMVTILYDRKLAAHDDIETFTMNPGIGRMTSCIQVKLHPYF